MTRERILSVLVFVVMLGGWEAAIWTLGTPAFLLPSPSDVVRTLAAEIWAGTYWWHLAVTLTEVLLGFACAAVAGIVVGAVIAEVPLADRVCYPYLVAFQTFPKIAIAPLLIIWFGFGLTSKVVIAALVAFFPVMVNVIAGLRTVDARRLALMRSLGATRWDTFVKLKLPSALPFLFAGLDIAIVFAVIGAIVGEFVGAEHGLGSLIVRLQFTMDVAGVFAVLVVLSVVGVALHLIVRTVSKRVVFWAQTDHILNT
jgi:NitT/TauT family transport system permease protein